MHAVVDTRVDDLGNVVRQFTKTARHSGCGGTRQFESRGVAAKKCAQNTSSGRLKGAVSAWVLRMHWRPNKGLPSWIALGGVVAVQITVADRRYRAPEVVLVLRLKDCHARIRRSDRKQREEAGIVDDVETFASDS